jgi:hypothetical protein
MNMSIRDVRELVGGQLQFGPLPPLDGQRETIGRILPTCQNVRPRDVVLWSKNQEPRDCFLEEAYARGALGIIAQRTVAPWAGRFSLTVADARDALSRLAWWRGNKLQGRRVVIVDPLTPSPTYHLLCQILRHTTSEMEYAASYESEESMLWQIIALDPNSDNALVHVTELPSSRAERQAYAADVAVFCAETSWPLDPSSHESFADAARHLKADTHVVMPIGMVDGACEIGWRGPVTSYGFDDRCDVSGARTRNHGLRAVNGVAITPNNAWRYAEHSALAAVATARALGIAETEVIERMERQPEGDDQWRRVAS